MLWGCLCRDPRFLVSIHLVTVWVDSSVSIAPIITHFWKMIHIVAYGSSVQNVEL